MTQQRRDDESTEFGIWLRHQPEIDSSRGYVATNIDYIWKNYKSGKWMIIEEKRFGGQPKFYQQEIFDKLDLVSRNDQLYCGLHIIVFENTSPDDGFIKIDGIKVDREELINFLQFKGL